jgi:putative transposase
LANKSFTCWGIIFISKTRRDVEDSFESHHGFLKVEYFIKAAKPHIEALECKQKCGKPRTTDLDGVLTAIWLIAVSGIQWRYLSLLKGIPYSTIVYHFLRWSRLGLWKEIGLASIQEWKMRFGVDEPVKTAIVDSRSVKSTPTCGVRGIDGGKKVKGVKLHTMTDKFGLPLDFQITPANVGDRDGLRGLAEEAYFFHPSIDAILTDFG